MRLNWALKSGPFLLLGHVLLEATLVVRDGPTVQAAGEGGCRRPLVSLRQSCLSKEFRVGAACLCLLGSNWMSLLCVRDS